GCARADVIDASVGCLSLARRQITRRGVTRTCYGARMRMDIVVVFDPPLRYAVVTRTATPLYSPGRSDPGSVSSWEMRSERETATSRAVLATTTRSPLTGHAPGAIPPALFCSSEFPYCTVTLMQ